MKFGSSCVLLFYICKLANGSTLLHFNYLFQLCSVLVSAIVLVTKSLKCYEGREVTILGSTKKDREEKDCEDGSVCIKNVGCVFQIRNFGKIVKY